MVEVVSLDKDAMSEIRFWLDIIHVFNGQSIWKAVSAVRLVYSNASSTGFGGYVLVHGCHISHGQWKLDVAGVASSRKSLTGSSTNISLSQNALVHR